MDVTNNQPTNQSDGIFQYKLNNNKIVAGNTDKYYYYNNTFRSH